MTFPHEVAERLKHYVYRLIDPRNGATFYIGRGQGDRVFQHAADAVPKSEVVDDGDLKISVIRAIKAAGFQVQHIIHRHGLERAVAQEVEAALIDAYQGLTNVQVGYAAERGVMHAQQIVRLYAAAEFPLHKHKLLLVEIANSVAEGRTVLDASRYQWGVKKARAEQVDYVLGVDRGIVRGAFLVDRWMEASRENFPGFPDPEPNRFGFVGHDAPAEVTELYVGKRAPPKKRGAAGSFRYI